MYTPMNMRKRKTLESEKGSSFQAFASKIRLAVEGRASMRMPNTGTIKSNNTMNAMILIDHPNPIRGCNS